MSTNGNGHIANPNEYLEIPNWINESYFAQILKKDVPNHVKVLDFTTIAATPPGENFTSIMVRVCMTLELKDGSTKQKSYILKTTLDSECGGNVVEALNLFPKEIKMYQQYLPEFEALYKNAGRDVQLAPRCLLVDAAEDRITIIFEDLAEQNFQNVNRLQGFDMKHMRRVLQKMAELHAASAVWVERNGPFPKEYHSGFVNNNREGKELNEKIFAAKLNTYKKAMATWGLEEADKYIRKFPTFEQFWKCNLRSQEPNPADFNVLNHGDFWSGNVMLNYLPNGEIDRILLLDHQICKWGSPAQDLLFFITISAAQNIRIKEFDHFVEIYHEHLIHCLTLLQYKRPLPKLRELQMDTYKEENAFYAFFATYNHLCLILLPTDKDSNCHMLFRDDEAADRFRMRAFMNPLYVEAMLDLFPFFHRRGIFNFEDYS